MAKLTTGDKLRQLAAITRFWAGYALFFSVVIYAIYNAPEDIFRLRTQWMLGSVIFIIIMFVIQVVQVRIFLDSHDVKYGYLWPALFTARKGILNTIMPAKTGSLVLIGMLTQHYDVKWYHYVKYSAVGAIIAIVASILAVVMILFDFLVFLLLLGLYLILIFVLSRKYSGMYMNKGFHISASAALLYMTLIGVFWTVFNGVAYNITVVQASQYAVASNALAQVSITPGNIGVRELVLGLISPYMSVPVSVGAIVGSIFFVIRTLVYALAMVVLDYFIRRNNILM